MLSRQPADIEQPRLDGFQPPRVERQSIRGPGNLVLGVVRFDQRPVERRERLGKQRMIDRATLDTPGNLPKLGKRAFAAAEKLVQSLQRFARLGPRLHRRALFGEPRLLPRLRIEGLDFADRKRQIIAIALGFGGCRSGRCKLLLDSRHALPGRFDTGSVDRPECIEQGSVAARIQKPAIVVLPVDFDEQRGKVADRSRRHRRSADEAAASAVVLQRSPENQRLPRIAVEALFFK